ncbi:MAG: HAD hydrolase family protein [Clostridia bacterium]|jgi:predicted HAD superfamily phosphohydrolase|nr:HAD hydrolase family protein [Clostridia bacterium]
MKRWRKKSRMKQINLDCEGPITKNDNALEISGYFLPEGEKFFSLLSRYDDFLTDIIKRKGYRAGTTLAFILPFLKAYGASNKIIKEYSRNHLLFIPGAKRTLSCLKEKMPTFIISTSYQPYIEALCDATGFPEKNTYSTALDLDKYQIPEQEIKRLKKILQEIIALPSLNLSGVKKKEDLSLKMQKTIQQLNEIFQKEIPSMEGGRILKEVSPLGGKEKAKAVLASLQRTGGKLSDVMYVGDSITDVEALSLVKEAGLAISFNGNAYALRAAELACISPHTFLLEILAEVFCREGKKGVFNLVKKWPNTLERKIKEKIPTFKPSPQLEITKESNLTDLIKKSEKMRKELRGEIVGKLG